MFYYIMYESSDNIVEMCRLSWVFFVYICDKRPFLVLYYSLNRYSTWVIQPPIEIISDELIWTLPSGHTALEQRRFNVIA